jgi:integrase
MAKSVARKDEAEAWPFIRWKEKRQRWMVDARTKDGGERKFFESKPEAEGYAQQQRILRENEGTTAFDDRELAAHGWTVAMAIKFAVEHLRKQKKSIPLADAIKKLEAVKLATKKDPYYCRLMRQRLEKLVPTFEGRNIGDITAEELELYLNDLDIQPGTRNTIRRDMVTLWSFATARGFAQTNEAKKVEDAEDIDGTPAILTPQQAEKLLKACEGDVLAYHAIGLFSGLRVAEIGRLDWSEIDFEGGYIHVSARKAKTRTRRLVPILPNLRAWLEPIAKSSGPIREPNFQKRMIAARRKAGFGKPGSESDEEKAKGIKLEPWPENGLRHSFVTYRLTDTGNAAQTALESGHDQDVMFAHYRELTRPKTAREFYELLPI